MNILLIQGVGEPRNTVQTLLESAGHKITVLADSDGAVALAVESDVILVNADDLYEMACAVVRYLRSEGVRTPIMMVSNRDSWSDKVGALDTGVDDYLSRPVSDQVLLGRIQALAKRAA